MANRRKRDSRGAPELNAARASSLRERLIAWYSAEHRSLPWRECDDAYRIWISEAMLQQTRVETVLRYWPRFVERFPTLEALAESEEQDVLGVWSGLGYYSRARKLREAAAEIVRAHHGEFPRTRAAALALPGVGPYTAGAVLSIAYDLPEALVDGNVQRVFCRLFDLQDEAGSTALQKRLWALAERLVPERGAGTWNQALMELGATICAPRAPRCEACPLRRGCAARQAGRAEELPRARAKAAPTPVRLHIFVAERRGRLLLEQRPPAGRMAGLWQFPTIEGASAEDSANADVGELFPRRLPRVAGSDPLARGATLGTLRHSITRYRIQAEIHSADLVGEAPPAGRWFSLPELEEAPLTGMARKVLRVRE